MLVVWKGVDLLEMMLFYLNHIQKIRYFPLEVLTLVSYPCYRSEIKKFLSMKFISGSDFNNTRIPCQENLDLWIVLFASGELLSLSCTHSLILRSQFCRDQRPRKQLFQIIRTFWNGSLINMQELCHPWIQPIKILQSYFKEQVALKESGRERKIRLFLPRRNVS